MNGEVKNVRVAWKIAVQRAEEFDGGIRLIGKHGTTYTGEPNLAFQIFVSEMRTVFSQERERFLAVSSLGELDSFLRPSGRIDCGRFRRLCCT